jgi:hypothetical protein
VKTVILVPIIVLVPIATLFVVYIVGFGLVYSNGDPVWNNKGIAFLEMDTTQ